MGKYLFSVLSILLLTVVLSLNVFASDIHEIASVDLVRNENIYKAKVSVKLPPQPEALSTILDLKSLELAQGFQKATVNNVDQLCRADGGKVMCNHEKDATNLIYEFVWQPQEIIESEYCKNVTLEKQKSSDEKKNYFVQFVSAANKAYPYTHKIVINGVTTSGKLSETYADFASDKSFAILWTTNICASQENRISEISFVKNSSIEKISQGASLNGQSYRPYAGSLSGFEAQEQYNIYLINTKKNILDVEKINIILCKSENIEKEKFIVNFSHELYDGKKLLSTSSPSKNVTTTWDEIIYDAEIVPTPTISPTSAKVPTSTPTPQATIAVSTSNATNTPSQINVEQSLESKADSTSSQTNSSEVSTNSEFNNEEEGGVESGIENEVGGNNILGESTNRANTKQKSVISTPTGDEPVGWRDPLFEYANNTAIRVVFTTMLVFLAASCFLILSLKSKRMSPITRDPNLNRDDKKSGFIAKLFNKVRKFVGIFVVFMFVFARPAAAQSAHTSIKITDSFIMHGTGAYTGVMNIIYTYVTKQSSPGKYVISKNPDGTGDIEVGNYLQGIVKNIYYASSKSYYVGPADGSGKHYICPDITTLSPEDVSAWFPTLGATYQITFRFITSCQKDFPVSDLYLVFVPEPTSTPSATPTSTMTPTPTPFAPFLDLPWDYRSKGLGFSNAATAMTSYFDHEYPLLSQSVIGLRDPDDQVYNYRGAKSYEYAYTKHDGYDYAKRSQANYSDPQLAAADGIATLHRDFWQQGNAIYIDHKNGFQTRYYHLDHKDLLTSETDKSIEVKQGQMIGRIGFTGNTDPHGEGGAHIHFMVIYDKNHDGNFDDNIPDGLVDPYGWMGEEGADPWESAVFQYPYGTSRTGMRSSYLWKYDLMDESAPIGPEGGELAGDGVKIQVPRISLDQILNFHMRAVPRPREATQSANLEIMSSVTEITAKDAEGAFVRYFNNPFNIIIDLTTDVAKYYKPGSISIYSSDDGETWQKEPTTMDLEEGKAKAEVNHLTLFTIMGEKKDILPPTTSIKVTGLGKNNIFRSDAELMLDVTDEVDSLGIDYTLFTLDSEADWQEYIGTFSVASEGAHMIKAFSVDKSGNIESPKVLSFVIDKTAPEINIQHATESGELKFVNAEQGTLRQAQGDNLKSIIAEDEAGNTHELNLAIQEAEGMQILRIDGGSKNGETVNYKPSIYAISQNESEIEVEYLLSGDDITRIMRGENGEVFIIRNDEIEVFTGERPLQMVTNGDRLKIRH